MATARLVVTPATLCYKWLPMNTPAHVAVNFVILAKKGKPRWSLPIVMGSLMPDIPIYLFYFYQKLIAGMSERIIWSDVYFRPSWQNLFDSFHSFPILLISAILSYRFGRTGLALFFSSMFLHSLGDFPLHNNDAHRHFFPVSDYRFFSPLSYWDSRHYGGLVSIVESLLVLCLSVIIWRRDNTRWHRAVPAFVILFYLLGYGVALVLWS